MFYTNKNFKYFFKTTSLCVSFSQNWETLPSKQTAFYYKIVIYSHNRMWIAQVWNYVRLCK